MKPRFIVVEGLEGAGKTSVISIIQSFLNSKDCQNISTREPGGTPMAEAIRDCVKHQWTENVTTQTELLLMYASRSQLVHNIIQPALSDNTWVIGDRHDWSSIAYQGGGRQLDIDVLKQIRQLTLGDFEPDFTLYLDIDPELGLQRARGRGELDRIEQSDISFFERARSVFQSLVQNSNKAVMIDASKSMDIVHRAVLDALQQWHKTLEEDKLL